jgi:hypothetical protein
MLITEVLAAIQPMSAADYGSHAQQRSAELKQASAARRAELKAKQQAAQQAQAARNQKLQPKKLAIKVKARRRRKSRNA